MFYILVHKNSCFTRRTATDCSSSLLFIAKISSLPPNTSRKLHTLDLFEFKVSVQPVAQLFRRLGIFWNFRFFLLVPSRQKQFTSTASITSSTLSVSCTGTNFARLLSRCKIFQVAHFAQKQKLFYSGFDCVCSLGEKGSLKSMGIWRLRLWARQRAFKRSVPVSRFQPITD